jgi:chromosome segregation ATPase
MDFLRNAIFGSNAYSEKAFVARMAELNAARAEYVEKTLALRAEAARAENTIEQARENVASTLLQNPRDVEAIELLSKSLKENAKTAFVQLGKNSEYKNLRKTLRDNIAGLHNARLVQQTREEYADLVRTRLQELRLTESKLSAAYEEATSLRAANEQLEDAAHRLQDRTADLETNLSQARSAIEEASETERQHTNLVQKLQLEMTSLQEQLLKVHNEANALHVDKDNLERTAEHLQARASNLETDIFQARDELQVATEIARQSAALVRRLKQHSDGVERQMRVVNERLQERTSAANEQIASIKKDLDVTRTRFVQEQGVAEDSQRALAHVQQQMQALRHENDYLRTFFHGYLRTKMQDVYEGAAPSAMASPSSDVGVEGRGPEGMVLPPLPWSPSGAASPFQSRRSSAVVSETSMSASLTPSALDNLAASELFDLGQMSRSRSGSDSLSCGPIGFGFGNPNAHGLTASENDSNASSARETEGDYYDLVESSVDGVASFLNLLSETKFQNR